MATTTSPGGRWSPSLGARIFLLTAVIIALSVGLAIALTYLFGSRIARRAAAESLTGSQAVQASFEEQRARQLELIARLFTSDSFFTGYVVEATQGGLAGDGSGEIDRASILDLLRERRDDLGLDFGIILDEVGVVLAHTERPAAAGRDLSADPLVAAVLADLTPATGIWREADGLYQAAVIPLAHDLNLLGFLVAGLAIDDELAIQVKRVSRTEVSYLSRGEDGFSTVASTLDVVTAGALGRQLAAAGPGGDDATAAVEREVELDGRRWITRASPLADAAGDPVGVAVALASMGEQLASYRRLQAVLLAAGLASILLALVSSFAVSRRLLRPVRELSAQAAAAAKGDYDAGESPGAERQDEVGRLARAFQSLLSDLREKRDIEAYLADLSRHLPSVTAGPAATGSAAVAVPARYGATRRVPTDELGTDWRTRPPPTGATPPAEALAAGSLLGGRYEILSCLGAGGMGIVYKARDREIDDLVALKMIRAAGDGGGEYLEQLKSELKLARRITHPNVVRNHDFGEIDGLPYLSMEYVQGLTLRYLLEQTERVPFSAGLRIARHLCRGLAAAHRVGVLHRDIKPENLILEPSGNAKLMDFGIARPRRRAETGGQVTPDAVMGTPPYLSPELLAGGEPEERDDIWACGVVFYELFAHRLPFAGRSPREIAAALREPLTPPGTHWPGMPPVLEALILRALARRRQDRHPDVSTLLAELESIRA